MKRIALITYEDAPGLINEDQPLLGLLRQKGIQGIPLVWGQPEPQNLDGIVVRTCWDSHLRPQEFIGWIDNLKAPILNPKAAIKWIFDKIYLLEMARKGVAIPPTQLLPPNSADNRTQFIMKSGIGELVIKPTISASAYGTFRLQGNDQAAISTAISSIPDSSPILLQKFIPEILSEGELSFIFFNGKISHVIQKRPKPGDFRVQGDFGASRELVFPEASLIEEAKEILQIASGLSWLYARIDVVPVNGKLVLMEVEAIDPMLYFTWAEQTRDNFAQAIADRF